MGFPASPVGMHPVSLELGCKGGYTRGKRTTANSGFHLVSFAGLGYLTLWLAAKLSVGFPYLPQFPVEGDDYSDERTSVRARGAAPPVLMMILAFFPTAVAFFIASSRWFNYRHHGFDIICGGIIGVFFAYIGLRMYHLPIQRGAGWAWGPRNPRRAFVRGIGFPSSLGTDSWTYTRNSQVAQVSSGSRHAEPAHDVENIPMEAPPEEAAASERV